MKRAQFSLPLIGWLIAAGALAQHEGHHPSPTPTPTPEARPSRDHTRQPTASATPVAPDQGHVMGHTQMEQMSMPAGQGAADTGRNLFQSDMSLMTGMIPKDAMAGMATPKWHVMDLGIARVSYNRQGGPSGGSEVESSNWNMIHAVKEAGPGRLSLMMMNSLEPATFPKRGSRELFQTGESYRGEPLVDRQHPHDFFMNLSATYRLNLGADSGAWLQVAPVGEPAIGPVAFMHRASSGDNPTAPLGHHWQDSTHISFNVVTLGAGWRWIGLEGSVFHGAEPDEHRWDIEGGSIDSAAGRLKLYFGNGWSAQVSHAFLKHPEELVPGDNHRTTAALYYGAEGDRPFAATVLWGRNNESHGVSDSYLLEAAYQLTARDQVYGRAEYVEKEFELLATKRSLEGGPHVGPDIARIGAVTGGYVRDFDPISSLKTGLGADVTFYSFPSGLKPAYGSFPVSIHGFLRLRWGAPHGGMEHAGHVGMKM